jgi:hypothetical protein
MKNFIIISLISLSFFGCSKGDKNPLIVPPNYSEVPNLNDSQKIQENIGNQEKIDKLKESLQKNNNF